MSSVTAFLVWRPPVGAIGSAVLLLVLSAWLAWVYTRLRRPHGRARAILLLIPKVVLFFLLTIALFDPAWGTKQPSARPPRLLALVDVSSSMEARDRPEGTRYDRAEHLLARLRQALHGLYEIDRRTMDTSIHASHTTISSNATVRGTALGACLRDAAVLTAREGHDAVLLLTDGGDSKVDDLPRPDVPLYVVGVGSDPSNWNDVRVSEVSAPATVNIEARFEVNVAARITWPKDPSAEDSTAVEIALDEHMGNVLRPVDAASVIPVGGRLQHPFQIPSGADTGVREFLVRVAPRADEVSPLNNRRRFRVDVRRRRIPVLLCAEALTWDTRYLHRVLDADPEVRLTTRSRVTERRVLYQGAIRAPGITNDLDAASLDRRVLDAFDCVIVAPWQEAVLTDTEQQALVDYVDRGGALVLVGSAGGASAADLLSPWRSYGRTGVLQLGPFPIGPARGAYGHPLVEDPMAILSSGRTPMLPAIYDEGRLKEGAVALFDASIAGRPVPVIAFQAYGQGAVLGIASTSLWTWYRNGGSDRRGYARLWQQAVRYLGHGRDAGRLLTVHWNRADYQPGETAEVRISVAGDFAPGALRIDGELRHEDTASQLALERVRQSPGNVFEGRIVFPRVGIYTIVLRAMAGTALLEEYERTRHVGPSLNEGAILEVDHAFLEHMARRTGDLYVPEAQIERVIAALKNQGEGHAVFQSVPLVQRHGIYLFAVLATLLVEWLLRRRYNLF